MTTPKYFKHTDLCIRFLEWKALNKADPTNPELKVDNLSDWSNHFYEFAKDWQKQLGNRLSAHGKFALSDFYEEIERGIYAIPQEKKPLARPAIRRSLAYQANERKAQGRRTYQKAKLGDAFVENDTLISAIKLKAKELSDTRDPSESFLNEVSKLASELSETPLSDDQLKAMSDLVSNEISKHQALDRAEAKLIDLDDKNAWFLWGKIKRNHTKESTFTLSARQVADYASVSKDSGTKLVKQLIKAGVIQQLSKGKSSKTERIAGLYQRLL